MARSLEEKVVDYLYDIDDSELIDIWNHIQIEHTTENEVYPMYDLGLTLEGMDPVEIVKEFAGTEFDPYDDWFYIDIYGYHSFCSIMDSPIDIQELAHTIVCDNDDCGEGELEDILNGRYDDEEDEEED